MGRRAAEEQVQGDAAGIDGSHAGGHAGDDQPPGGAAGKLLMIMPVPGAAVRNSGASPRRRPRPEGSSGLVSSMGVRRATACPLRAGLRRRALVRLRRVLMSRQRWTRRKVGRWRAACAAGMAAATSNSVRRAARQRSSAPSCGTPRADDEHPVRGQAAKSCRCEQGRLAPPAASCARRAQQGRVGTPWRSGAQPLGADSAPFRFRRFIDGQGEVETDLGHDRPPGWNISAGKMSRTGTRVLPEAEPRHQQRPPGRRP